MSWYKTIPFSSLVDRGSESLLIPLKSNGCPTSIEKPRSKIYVNSSWDWISERYLTYLLLADVAKSVSIHAAEIWVLSISGRLSFKRHITAANYVLAKIIEAVINLTYISISRSKHICTEETAWDIRGWWISILPAVDGRLSHSQ